MKVFLGFFCLFISCFLYSGDLKVLSSVFQSKDFSTEEIIATYADGLVQTAARYENDRGKVRGVPLSLLYDAAYTFTIAYDLQKKSKFEIFLRTHPRVEKSAYFTAGAAAMYAALWFKRFMHL